MILFDTDICVEILRGNRRLVEQRRGCDEPVAELYYGVYKSTNLGHFNMIDGLEVRNWRSAN